MKYKVVFLLFLISISALVVAGPESLNTNIEIPIVKKSNNDQVDVKKDQIIPQKSSLSDKTSDDKGRQSPSKDDAINLGLSPEWTKVSDNTDNDRKDYGAICLKNCKKKSSFDSDLEEIKNKFKNK